jgi:hypothetical protein
LIDTTPWETPPNTSTTGGTPIISAHAAFNASTSIKGFHPSRWTHKKFRWGCHFEQWAHVQFWIASFRANSKHLCASSGPAADFAAMYAENDRFSRSDASSHFPAGSVRSTAYKPPAYFLIHFQIARRHFVQVAGSAAASR